MLRRRMLLNQEHDIQWEVFSRNSRDGYLNNNSTIINFLQDGIPRAIIFPCKPNTKYTVTKALQTTMRIGFLENYSSTVLISNATQITATEIEGISDSNASYCITQLCTTPDTTQYSWSQIIDGLQITEE